MTYKCFKKNLIDAMYEARHSIVSATITEEIAPIFDFYSGMNWPYRRVAIEFENMEIPFTKEAKIEIYYKGRKLEKEYFADFICYDNIIVELKCVSKLVNANKAQVINYLHGTNKSVGLLINFGESSLKWERLTLLKNV